MYPEMPKTDRDDFAPKEEVHPLQILANQIDQTHRGLGALAVIGVITAKALKCLMIVGPPGTGKSAVVEWLGKNLPEAYVRGDLTMAAMRKYNQELSNSEACILVDDIGACNSDWNRIQTCVALAELCYSHEMIKDTHQIKVEITNYQGSAIMGIQPNVLAEIVRHTSWHSNLADKSLRYYHLIRPTTPTRAKIRQELDWGVDFQDVLEYNGDSPLWDELLELGLEQWSTARAHEHLHDMVRACAALRESYTVEDGDIALLLKLIRPMSIEMEAVVKAGFGSEATLNQNLIYLLTEFASYPIVTYDTIGTDYKMRPTQVRHILEGMQEWYEKISNNPVILRPTERLKEILEHAGIRGR